MKTFLRKVLNIERGEEKIVLLLLTQSFFLGVFVATFDIGANTLFMDTFGASKLANAFLISGAAGLVLTTVYSKLQSVINFSKLAIINLVTIAALTCLMRFGFEVTSSKWLIYLVFVMMGPLNVLAMLGFWGVAGRIFNLRQGKRIFGMIDSGQVFGSIVISFSIPLILVIMPAIKDILLVSAISVVFGLLCQLMILRNSQIERQQESKKSDKPSQSLDFKALLKTPFTLMMSLFVVLSMMSAFFVHYTFLAVTEQKYPNSTELANFLGVFTASAMIFSFIVKTFLYSKLLKMYGLKVSLLILPFLLLLFTALSALVGSFMGFGVEAAGFTFFFLLISLSKLFSRSIRESIELPSFKLFYQPLHKDIRYDVQAKIDGMVNEFAALLSGLTLAILGSIQLFKLIHFSYFLLAILAGWVFIAIKLYQEYHNTLKSSLANYKVDDNAQSKTDKSLKELLQSELQSGKPQQVLFSLKISEDIEPILHSKSILQTVSMREPLLKEYSLNKIEELRLTQATNIVKLQSEEDSSQLIKKLAQQVAKSLNEAQEILVSNEKIVKLAKSRNVAERELAAKLIYNAPTHVQPHTIIDLIKDIHPKVKKAAMKAASNNFSPELLPMLIDNLPLPIYQSTVRATLIKIGIPVLDKLDQAFYKAGFERNTLIKIVRIYGIIGGEKAVRFLFNKLSFPDAKINTEALKALKHCDFQASAAEFIKIEQAIETTIENAAWNIAALTEVEDNHNNTFLIQALKEELNTNYRMLYLLLSLAYDSNSVQLIKENIESKTTEGIGFAIELLDLFLAEELKAKLFPLLEDTETKDKLEQLQVNFPREKFDSIEVLKQIMNRDYNQINRYTKACAIYSLKNSGQAEISNDLLANLFNPDILLRETAAWVTSSIDEEVYQQCSLRLESSLKNNLDQRITLAKKNSSVLLIEKIFELKQSAQLASLPGMVLAEIAENIYIQEYQTKQLILEPDVKGQHDVSLFFIARGTVSLIQKGEPSKQLSQGNMFGQMHLSRDTQAISESSVTLFKLEQTKIYELMENYTDFADTVLSIINDIDLVVEPSYASS